MTWNGKRTRFVLDLDAELIRRVKIVAATEGKTLSGLVTEILSAALVVQDTGKTTTVVGR